MESWCCCCPVCTDAQFPSHAHHSFCVPRSLCVPARALLHAPYAAHQVDTEGLYKTLGVAKDADEKAIRKAYRKIAVKEHPDKGEATPTKKHWRQRPTPFSPSDLSVVFPFASVFPCCPSQVATKKSSRLLSLPTMCCQMQRSGQHTTRLASRYSKGFLEHMGEGACVQTVTHTRL